MTNTPSVRERISAIATKLIPGTSQPEELVAFELSLVGLMLLIQSEVTAAEVEYRKAVLRVDEPSASARKQVAEAGPEYQRWLEAKAVDFTVDQMIKSCRSALRLFTEQARRG